MAELRPYPFDALCTRAFRELDERGSIFDLPRKRFFLGDADRDLSVRFHGHRPSSPLGPAAGPQTQMAQNIVLSWLGGCRIMELKTVQIMDELRIPRPCIDMQTVGYNVEWSQELKLEQSLDEYVKGSMLIEMLVASGRLELSGGFDRVHYDMSVGYDLAGIRTDRVQAFIRGMLDASDVVERMRERIPRELGALRDLDFQTKLSDTLTLSTFHGCPPDEIEAIIDHLLDDVGLHCIVKLNPMLLGPDEARRLLNDVLGYEDVRIPDSAFENDTKWAQAQGFVERLGAKAERLGLGFGVKFSNTLIVENHRDFFPAEEKQMYLSGPPLHVLAMNLVRMFRRRFGDRYPISFSAGVDRGNFAESVGLGLVPVTVCSDLLKPGGYARASGYFAELQKRMAAVGAGTLDDFVLRAEGRAEEALAGLGLDEERAARCRSALADGGDLRAAAGDAFDRWVSAARLLNTESYVERATADPRYALAQNRKAPRKVGSMLVLLDCLTCDKCIPVCPNDANFTFVLPRGEVPVVKARRDGEGWSTTAAEPLRVDKKHQIGCFADFCNECGNCDVFCPEDGGPYAIKPLFFGTLADFEELADHDGFHLARDGEVQRVHGRFSGRALVLEVDGDTARLRGDGFDVRFERADPAGTLAGEADGEVDLTWFHIMDMIREAMLATDALAYPSLVSG